MTIREYVAAAQAGDPVTDRMVAEVFGWQGRPAEAGHRHWWQGWGSVKRAAELPPPYATHPFGHPKRWQLFGKVVDELARRQGARLIQTLHQVLTGASLQNWGWLFRETENDPVSPFLAACVELLIEAGVLRRIAK